MDMNAVLERLDRLTPAEAERVHRAAADAQEATARLLAVLREAEESLALSC